MRNLEEATERICELKGDLVALDALIGALLTALPDDQRAHLQRQFGRSTEAARTAMLNAAISDVSIAAFERDVDRLRALIDTLEAQARRKSGRAGVESLLLAAPRVSTFDGPRALTGASGFFFARDERLFLVTSRHVVFDERSKHFPDRLEIELHGADRTLAQTTAISLLLYRDGRAVWRQAQDTGGEVDVAVLEIDRAVLGDVVPQAFTPAHLQGTLGEVDVGTPLLIVGFPLGFHDGLHHLPVARQASIASSFGTRFQGQGFFLTDARMHRGSSGAPVVMRDTSAAGDLPWKLLGIHSARFDMGGRDRSEDESLGLNCAWYADVLMTLTADEAPAPPDA